MAENEALIPTNDYVFKRIFGRVGNEEITKGLISAIIGEEVKEVKLEESPILEGEYIDDKVGVLDVKAKLDNEVMCDIEMQIIQNSEIYKRILFYWSKLYLEGIQKGEKYKKLNKTILILIADFELNNIKEIEEYRTKWNLREERNQKVILTNVIEIYILELPKLIKQLDKKSISKEDKGAIWGRFIKNPKGLEEEEMANHDIVKRAYSELTKLQKDKREAYLAEQRLILKMDKEAMYDDGYDAGEKKGTKETKKQIVLNMHKDKVDIDTISKYTNLSKEEIEKIIKDNVKY